jgi:hypothetical protein
MRLAEIEAGWETIDGLLAESGGEITPEVEERLATIELAERDKVDAYVFKIRALQGDEASLKKLEEEIAAKRGARKRLREHLMARVDLYMKQREVTELQGNHYRFKYCKNGGKPPVEILAPLEDLPEEWKSVTVEPKKEVIREYLAANGGEIQPLARLGAPTYSIRIF